MQIQYSIKVLQSRFLQSADKLSNALPATHTEIAILGRSNVGKSSFINLLLNHKLAKSSSTPGKTQLINFFSTIWEVAQNTLLDSKNSKNQESLNTQTYHNLQLETLAKKVSQNITLQNQKIITIPLTIIDFPGFGYAKIDKQTKQKWDKNLSHFIEKRQSIKLFCHLIDSRHTQLEIDNEIVRFLESFLVARNDCKILQIYTKTDKLKKNEFHKLRNQNRLLISTLKKEQESLQKIYYEILIKSLHTNLENLYKE